MSTVNRGKSLSRLRTQQGWLLYAGNLGLIVADVLDVDISVQSSNLDVTSWASPFRQMVRGPTEIKFTAQLYEEKMQWDQNPTKGGPPHLAALLALARNHPDEYHELRERESVLKALGG